MDRDHRSRARQLTLLVTAQSLACGGLCLAAVRPPVAGVSWWRGFPQWVAAAPPLDAVVVVAHRIALVTAAWLLAGTVLHIAATAARWPGLARVTGCATHPAVRRAVAAFALGAGFTTGVLGAGYPASATSGAEAPRVRDGRAVATSPRAPTPTTVPPTVAMSMPEPARVPATPTVGPVPTAAMVVVQPGDSLWTIAERVAASEGGVDVASRWTAICVANAGRLRSGNPSVIYAGEEVIIPA